MRRRLEARLRGDTELERLLDEVVERRLDPASAAAALLERVGVGEDDREPADAP
jgi:LAO/AO transport system kinase